MTEEEKRQHALRIARESLDNVEFSWLYEDEELEDVSAGDLRDIHDMIRSYYMKVTFND